MQEAAYMLISVSLLTPAGTTQKFGYECTARADGRERSRKSSVMESKLSNVPQILQKIVCDEGETHAWQAMCGKTVEKPPVSECTLYMSTKCS